jgi:hypothetical protein
MAQGGGARYGHATIEKERFMKRTLLLALVLAIAGCSTSSTYYVKDTLTTLPSGDQVVSTGEIHQPACTRQAVMTREETAWIRAGQPQRVLTVSKAPDEKVPYHSQLQARIVDADHVVLADDKGEPHMSFDYDHARAYVGASVQPAWARAQTAGN